MALSKTRKAQLERIVVKAFYPNTDIEFDFYDNCAEVRSIDKSGQDSISRARFAEQVEQLTSCCGILEMEGLDNLKSLDKAQTALFELWLDFKADECLGVLATTESGQVYAIKVLKSVGFVEMSRGVNPNTSNTISLWFYQCNKSTLKEKARATSNRSSSRRSR